MRSRIAFSLRPARLRRSVVPIESGREQVTAAPVIQKYTGVLAAADVEAFTYTTTFTVLQSMRLDLGLASSSLIR